MISKEKILAAMKNIRFPLMVGTQDWIERIESGEFDAAQRVITHDGSPEAKAFVDEVVNAVQTAHEKAADSKLRFGPSGEAKSIQWNTDEPQCACGGNVRVTQIKYRCDCGKVFRKI